MYYTVCYSVESDEFIDHAVSFNQSDSVIDFLISNNIKNAKVYRVFPHKGSLPTISSLGKCKLKDRLKDLGIS